MSDTTCPWCGKDLSNYITDLELRYDGDSTIITCDCDNEVRVFINIYTSYDLEKVEKDIID
jgi:hypothetical protein